MRFLEKSYKIFKQSFAISEKTRTFAPVIELDRHIEILLLSNDCVIVPDLGGFMAHHVDARYDEVDGMFVPPIRTLGFNPQLRLNDSLLAQSYVETYDISYPEAVRRIEEEVVELRQHLETEGHYELNDIGVLSLNDEGNLTFEPCEAGILTPALYGLGSFQMPTLNARHTPLTSHHSALTPQMPEEGAITIKMSWLRNAVAVAAAIIAFLMIGTPISNSNEMTDVQQSSFISVPSSHKTTQSQTSDSPLSYSEENTDVVSSEGGPVVSSEVDTDMLHGNDAPLLAGGAFYIVMASQVSERNANIFVNQLKDQDFHDAHILISGTKHIRRVVYGCYDSEADANAALRQLRSESRFFKDSWIMEVKEQ